MNVVVIGSGSWGTALAIKSVLAGNTTTLYCVAQNLLTNWLKIQKIKIICQVQSLPKELLYSSDLETSIRNAEVVLMVTPSVHVRTSLESIKPYAHKNQSVIFFVQKGLNEQQVNY